MKYAQHTKVSVEKTRAEIERLLASKGATRFSSGWIEDKAAISFWAHGRLIRFVLTLPKREEVITELRQTKKRLASGPLPEKAVVDALTTETRRRWRSLLLGLKAKLELVDSGIESFEEAFCGAIMLPNQQTVYEAVAPSIEAAYTSGKMPKLLTSL